VCGVWGVGCNGLGCGVYRVKGEGFSARQIGPIPALEAIQVFFIFSVSYQRGTPVRPEPLSIAAPEALSRWRKAGGAAGRG